MNNINTLILSGAGANIIYEFGLCIELLKYIKPKKVIGTSAGAILSLAIALNWNFNELLEIFIQKISNKKIYNESIFKIIYNIFKYNYLFESDLRYEIIDIMLSKTNKDITFIELDFDISVVSVDYDTGNTILFNKKNTPQIRIKDAVLASSGIPGVFKPIFVDKNKILNIYDINNNDIKNSIHLVDGGITSMYPINFLSQKEIKNSIGISMLTKIAPAKKGLIDTLLQIINLQLSITNSDSLITNEWKKRTIFYKLTNGINLTTTLTKELFLKSVEDGKIIVDEFIKTFNQ